MSTFFDQENTCAVCGATSSYTCIGSTNSFGAPDLDLRPPPMQRDTMFAWIQACPACGYVADNVSDQTKVTKEWLQSKSYQTCDGIAFRSELAVNFYRRHLICLEEGNPENAFYAVLYAAWSCDDTGDDENARICRKLAASMAVKLIEGGEVNKENLLLIRADLMRRAGMFDELIEQYSSVSFQNELLSKILNFQIAKAKKKDTACYNVQSVTG
ncbi:DUF2225 domain-containing protein [bacterium]|nr:DUF2225 domain-containing protein [bacterium]